MPTLAFRIARKRVHVVEEMVEEWKIDHREAMLALDIQDLVKETASLLDPVERMIESFGDGIKFETDEDAILQAHGAGALLSKTIDLFPRVRELAESVTNMGHSIEGVPDMEAAKNKVIGLRDRFFITWMLPNAKTVRKSKEQFARGEYIEI